MKSTIYPFFLLIPSLLLFWVACGPAHPGEAEVRAKIVGEYCSDDYRLVLTDSTYQNVKYTLGPLSRTPMRESCNGTYSLHFEEGKWIIRFAKDDNPQGIKNCKGEYPLWSQEEGYLIGEEQVVMKDLFDGQELTRAACEE